MRNFNLGDVPTRYSMTVEPSASLDEVNRALSETEPDLGPLIAINNDGKMTVLVFQYADPVPPELTVLSPTMDGVPHVPDGHKLVCTGTIFVRGALTLCAATRPG